MIIIYGITTLLIISIYINFNLYFKVRKAEKTIVETDINADLKYIEFYKLFRQISSDLIAVDKRGSFKSDDQVGHAWKLFMELNDQLDELFKATITTEK